MIHRYFDVIDMDESDFTVSEYFGDFGYWFTCRATWTKKRYVDGQMWHFSSNKYQLPEAVVNDVIERVFNGGVRWSMVDMKSVSSPINLRKPAMGRKRGK